ncbi:EthD domain-containing protein [Sphingobium baderi]|uniref:EthD domain-containing protein n=1 Tax=Sphingobium baderi TaxID=1332080 RepID=A0A0S3F6A1_9SPHN|nr:EthD domain-containing protein [Sphingobium baderi]ALR23161.1 hypothetical protein ATN00_21925 [Sphingobium baderi]
MLKAMVLLKRRPDLTVAQFREIYETGHAKLGERLLTGRAVRYMRRYLNGIPNPVTGVPEETEYDVATEMWFADRESFESAMAMLGTPEIMAEVAADEETLFDRSRNRFFTLEERESACVAEAAE